MTSEVSSRRRQSVREIAVLVVGILVAFALDSWWDSRVQSSQRSEDLAALASDFTANRNQLVALVDHQDRVVASSRKLAELLNDSETAPDTLRSMLSLVFSSRRLEPLLGAYYGVIESDWLNRPSDRELRTALAGFAAAMEIRYVDSFADALYLDFIDDFPEALGIVFEGSGAVRDSAAVLSDSRFRTSLMLRTTAEAEVGRRYSALLERAEHILALLEEP